MVEDIKRKNLGRHVLSELQMEREERLAMKTKFVEDINEIGSLGGKDDKSCLTLAIPWITACQAPLSMGLPRQEYWSGFPFPSLIYYLIIDCIPRTVYFRIYDSFILQLEVSTS